MASPCQVARDAVEQPLRHERDLVHRTLERGGVPPRRLSEPAHLADELASGGADLVVRGDDVSMAEGLDASAHGQQR